ncbi:MAG TPA: chromosomal replication initiator DnaA [Xanthobacteraceae bacterium]|nr:chromosomal replication initiator DnaA [Xanthobacteraceae bacterium]
MASPVRARQLAFDLVHQESFRREDFVVGPSNAEAFALIARWPDWAAPVAALIGPEGAGKSHLAAIWAAEAGARLIAARALREAELPAALATGALVVEDLAAGRYDENALFHLLNLAREHEAFLLLTAADAGALRPRLPDLASRLRAVPAVRIGAPDETLLGAVLVKLFADRQLQVDAGLVRFLVSRIERSVPAARAAVAQLDAEALRRGRPVNRAFAAELFRAGGEGLC